MVRRDLVCAQLTADRLTQSGAGNELRPVFAFLTRKDFVPSARENKQKIDVSKERKMI